MASVAYYGDHREYEIDVSDLRVKVSTAAHVAVESGERVIVACEPEEVVVMLEPRARMEVTCPRLALSGFAFRRFRSSWA